MDGGGEVDTVTSKEIRTRNMRAIRSARTSSEDPLAMLIWRAGYRYRRNDKTVFGKPDLTFKKYKVAVFCDGEFWHGKDWAKKKKKISQNQAYWIPKIERNMQRDRLVDKTLREQGWQVIRSCFDRAISLDNMKDLKAKKEALKRMLDTIEDEHLLDAVERTLQGGSHYTLTPEQVQQLDATWERHKRGEGQTFSVEETIARARKAIGR